MTIDVRASLDADVNSQTMFSVVRDLETFPKWLDLVHRANPADMQGDLPAWDVELRAKIGPFARSKRLRMVRTIDQQPTRVVFERTELDRKKHAPWVLTCEVSELEGSCLLNVRLHYGGSLFDGGVIERVLADHIESGKAKLKQFLVGL